MTNTQLFPEDHSLRACLIIPQETGLVIVQTTTQKLRGYDFSIDWKFSSECRIIILPWILLCHPYRIFCSPRDPPIRLLGVKRRDQNASVFKTLIWKWSWIDVILDYLQLGAGGPPPQRVVTHTQVFAYINTKRQIIFDKHLKSKNSFKSIR